MLRQEAMTDSLFITLNPNWDPMTITLTYCIIYRNSYKCIKIRSHLVEKNTNARKWTDLEI